MKRFLPLIALLISFTASAQTDPLFNQYLFNQNMFNPAYTGTYNVFTGMIMSRAQWTGVEGSPLTTTVNATTSLLQNKLGAGLLVVNDRLGINNNFDIQGSFSYKINFLHSQLAFGMSAGAVSYQYDYNKLTLNANDPKLSQEQRPNFTRPTIGAGFFYRAENYYLGVSVPRLMNVTIGDGPAKTTMYKRQLYISAGVLFDQVEAMKIKSSVLFKVLDKEQSYVDFNTSVLLGEILWAGLSVRNFKTIGATAVLEISNKFRFGYYYELPSKSLLGSTFGTHEIMISADLEIFRGQMALRRYF